MSEKLALDEQKEAPQVKNLDFIMDIPLQLTVELGRTKLLVRDVLQLNQGSVVELTKLAGEPLDVFVNSKLVARGEAVVVNDKFGIRLLDIVSPNERVDKVL
ncbi:flagellar motor switch protein FliN [Geomonas ferrireducens]|uniref:flagellar motor switch protein FliN n=1 Tax=Geomonas ferrireducens TaxID=2570227 RepID=UPI0010A8BAA1|nr:flagellar motor switch protein FliN [Geomonas ferrireducens]